MLSELCEYASSFFPTHLINYFSDVLLFVCCLCSTPFLPHVLEKLAVQEHRLEEKLAMECLLRELWSRYCLLRMNSLILYVLKVPSQKAMVHQGTSFTFLVAVCIFYLFLVPDNFVGRTWVAHTWLLIRLSFLIHSEPSIWFL